MLSCRTATTTCQGGWAARPGGRGARLIATARNNPSCLVVPVIAGWQARFALAADLK
jgi:hypothetical protein